MAVGFRWGAMNEDTGLYVYFSSGPVNVGKVYKTYHTYTIVTEISGLSNRNYHIDLIIRGTNNSSYKFSTGIDPSYINDGKYIIRGNLSLRPDSSSELYIGCFLVPVRK